ncbi:HDOD domain-containing protein [Vibrio metoecus]|uniref:HDOD domain-containing protein n=1 Tax=Vibrio metoecus TaxID=1481663 RepID=A0A271VYN5_VIBMT|nr:HDOD domain-containing protein [Vibrio metoecus]KDO14409.1 histidine kinase [Vibrio metoecus]KQA99078.1 histidine kinase [Vibrio metoecus]KQB08805.1 histidine kinase [Vibrio metoecus]MCR9386394.1 HDOD domain-containing protein [Vibrio metoecus]PAR23234.1 HDOD domain-containing protein [Vibrio metoecus]
MVKDALLKRLNELPRLSKVLQELLDLANQPNVDFHQLSKKITLDQILTARLLRMANSAYFGGNGHIATVNDAIIRVGIDSVRTLVVASVLSSTFPKIETLNLNDYWINTFETALIASKIAEQVGLDKAETFTTGVLHNIGELMIHTLMPSEAKLIEQKIAQGVDPLTAQEEILGISAPRIGAMLAKEWKFPSEMVDAIKHFDEPREAEISPKLAVAIHFARDIHRYWDELTQTKDKSVYLADHPDSRLLNISATFQSTIDGVRGNGKEIATQMMAA